MRHNTLQLVLQGFLFFQVTVWGMLHPIEVQGYKFFDSVTGDEFVVRGIDYYPRPNYGELNHNSLDLYTNRHRNIWQRDIEYLKNLNVNVIRLYAVDASQNHDEFMQAMDMAGIYVIIALAHDCPTCAITRDAAPDCYPAALKLQGQRVIRAFSKYVNTLAFSAGNEVNHFAPPNQPEWNAPCQKKFIRDMRTYMASCSQQLRQIPIGLVSADNDREDIAQYYNCQENDDYDRAEWYGINTYVSCDGAASVYSDAPGFKLLEESFARMNYSIPVLLTEFGCLSDSFPTIDGYEGQRNFLQGKWLLKEPTLREQFSGGLAFEYSIERANAGQYPFKTFDKQGYGVGYFSPELCDDVNVSCKYNPMPSYKDLQDVYAECLNSTLRIRRDDFEVSPSRSGSSTCPTRFDRMDSFEWKADQTQDLLCTAEIDPTVYPDHKAKLANESFIAKVLAVALLLLMGGGVCYKRSQNKKSRPSQRSSDNISKHGSEDTGNDDLAPLLALRGLKDKYNSIEWKDRSS